MRDSASPKHPDDDGRPIPIRLDEQGVPADLVRRRHFDALRVERDSRETAIRAALDEALHVVEKAPINSAAHIVSAWDRLRRAGVKGPLFTTLEWAVYDHVMGPEHVRHEVAARVVLGLRGGDVRLVITDKEKAALVAPMLRALQDILELRHRLGAELSVALRPRVVGCLLDASRDARIRVHELRASLAILKGIPGDRVRLSPVDASADQAASTLSEAIEYLQAAQALAGHAAVTADSIPWGDS